MMAEITTLLGAMKSLWWPLAALILGIVYKVELRSLLPRLRSAGPTGVIFDAAQQQTEIAAEATTPAPGQLREFPGMIRTPAIQQLELRLHQQLNERRDLKDEEKRDLLIRVLAQAQLEAAFDRIYSQIYGSQILALRRLNARSHVTVDEAKEFFQEVERQYPEVYKNYGFDGWAGFLVRNNLVSQTGNSFEITDLGRDFLLYLTGRRLAENKAG